MFCGGTSVSARYCLSCELQLLWPPGFIKFLEQLRGSYGVWNASPSSGQFEHYSPMQEHPLDPEQPWSWGLHPLVLKALLKVFLERF